MADRTQHSSHGVLSDMKSALKGVRGAGDAIRGTFNESIDHAFHETAGEAKDKAVADKGLAEMDATERHFEDRERGGQSTMTGSGVPSAPTNTQPIISSGGGVSHSTNSTTRQGAHSGPVANMESTMPTDELGGEPESRSERF